MNRAYDNGNKDLPTNGQCHSISYEGLPWIRDVDELSILPKSQRRKILPTYQATIPRSIAEDPIELPSDFSLRIADLLVDLTRFDARQETRDYNLPALLLRSESSASSQIENLTSSIRNIALAELSDKAPENARLIVGNIAAMHRVLELTDDITIEGICEVHKALIEPSGQQFAGVIRNEQVWVGGSPYSPHNALFVLPKPQRIRACLDDLMLFGMREDVNPIAKAAIFHAQFETIHPFVDGNGRTGRTFLHKMLRKEGILSETTLPVSVGLLHNVDAYMKSLQAYQESNSLAIIEQLIEALELSLSIRKIVARQIENVLEAWRETIKERAGSSIWLLPKILVEQPVVDTAYLSKRLNIAPRAAANLVNRAHSYEIIRPIGNRVRGIYYQADEIISVLEDISSVQGIHGATAP